MTIIYKNLIKQLQGIAKRPYSQALTYLGLSRETHSLLQERMSEIFWQALPLLAGIKLAVLTYYATVFGSCTAIISIVWTNHLAGDYSWAQLYPRYCSGCLHQLLEMVYRFQVDAAFREKYLVALHPRSLDLRFCLTLPNHYHIWDLGRGFPEAFSGYYAYTPFGMANPFGRSLEEVWHHSTYITTPKVLVSEGRDNQGRLVTMFIRVCDLLFG